MSYEEDDEKHPPHSHAHGDEDNGDTSTHVHLLGSQFKGEHVVTIGGYEVAINPIDELGCESCQ